MFHILRNKRKQRTCILTETTQNNCTIKLDYVYKTRLFSSLICKDSKLIVQIQQTRKINMHFFSSSQINKTYNYLLKVLSTTYSRFLPVLSACLRRISPPSAGFSPAVRHTISPPWWGAYRCHTPFLHTRSFHHSALPVLRACSAQHQARPSYRNKDAFDGQYPGTVRAT